MMEITKNAIEGKNANEAINASFKEILDETDAVFLDALNKLSRLIECLSSPERSEDKPKQEDLCMRDELLRQRDNAKVLMQMVLKLENILF